MARRDITGAVDFAYLEDYAAGDRTVIEEVLALFREQASMWMPMLEPDGAGWRDAVHTIKGAARGIGAFSLGDACERAEQQGPSGLSGVRTAMDAALFDVAAYAHELELQRIRGK